MEMTTTPSAIGRLLLLLLLTGCGRGTPAHSADGPYDVVLKGGWIIDGSGNPRYRGDVAIRGDRVAAVGFLGTATAKDTVDVSGLVVAPGFIDMMGQSEINARLVEGDAGHHDGSDRRGWLGRAAHRRAGAGRFRRHEEMALPRRLA